MIALKEPGRAREQKNAPQTGRAGLLTSINQHNGTSSKIVLTDDGPLRLARFYATEMATLPQSRPSRPTAGRIEGLMCVEGLEGLLYQM